jgi:cardiolipin synthase
MTLALLLATTGCTLNRFDQRRVYHLAHPLAVSDEAFGRSLSAFGFELVGGNRAEIYNNGDAIFDAMIAAIGGARVSVNLESYIFSDDSAGRPVAAALMDAARRGVEVRVLVDGTGSKFSGPMLERMRHAGVRTAVYHALGLRSLHKIVSRTHRKILVVDGTSSFTGGFGIGERWLGDAREPAEWRDIMVGATGPVSAQMQAVFSEDWTYTTGEVLAGETFYPPQQPAGDVAGQAIAVSRGDASSRAAMLYYVAIESARRSILIQNAYFVPGRQLRDALAKAAKRGVDVRLMVPGRHMDQPLVAMTMRRHYGSLLRAGVRILEYDRTMMHNKDAVIDGVFTTIGSINFDPRSLHENAEESLAFYDRGLGERLEAVFADDARYCREISLADWQRRGFRSRMGEAFAGLFRPFY